MVIDLFFSSKVVFSSYNESLFGAVDLPAEGGSAGRASAAAEGRQMFRTKIFQIKQLILGAVAQLGERPPQAEGRQMSHTNLFQIR